MWSVAVPYYDDFFSVQGRLEAAEGAATILDLLDYMIDILEILPDKAADAQVFGNAFFSTVVENVYVGWSPYWNIIDI